MTSISYRLPKSEVVVSGIARTSTDPFATAPQTTTSLVDLQIAIQTSADSTNNETVALPTGWFRSYKGSFSTLQDGRLSAASGESTGELGTVLKSVATIAGTVVGAVILGAEGDAPVDDLDSETITDAYSVLYPALKTDLENLREAQASVRGALLTALCADPPQPADVRQRRLQLAHIEEQLTPLVAHFRTWRKSKVHVVDQRFSFRAGLNEIPLGEPGVGELQGADGAPSDLATLWTQFGYTVRGRWVDNPGGARPAAPAPTTRQEHTIYARRPEQLELTSYRRDGDQAVVTGISRHFVADAGSVITGYLLKKTWFARNSLTLAFDGNGFVSGVSTEGGSEVAGAAGALAALPEGFSGGVEGATKTYTALRSAGRASIEAETARIKAEVERREQELLAAGQAATGQDAAELVRLTQLQSILDAQTKIQGADPTLVMALAGRAGRDLDWYAAPPPAAAPEPQVIQVVVTSGGPGEAAPPIVGSPPTLGG